MKAYLEDVLIAMSGATTGKVGFSNELIDAINATPQMESQEHNVDDICYQAIENGIISSTELNISNNINTFNYYGNEIVK